MPTTSDDDDDFDTAGTDKVVCPWCGFKYSDSSELFSEYADTSDEIECEECDRKFTAEREFDVTYTTDKIIEDD